MMINKEVFILTDEQVYKANVFIKANQRKEGETVEFIFSLAYNGNVLVEMNSYDFNEFLNLDSKEFLDKYNKDRIKL